MIAIPLPFIVSLLLLMLACVLWVHTDHKAKASSVFVLICALMTAIVGLRWSVDWQWLRGLQPVIASLVPVGAWLCFSQAHRMKMNLWHLLGPGVILLGSLSYPLLQLSLDLLLMCLYIGYGTALLRAAPTLAEGIRLSYSQRFFYAETAAGYLLFFSALIDMALAVSFTFFDGRYADYVLTVSYVLLLPFLVLIVAWVGLHTHAAEPESEVKTSSEMSMIKPEKPQLLSDEDAAEIVRKFEKKLKEQEIFRDPDLTLNRLSRKLVLPAKLLSSAINQVYRRNVSQVINEFRIAYAQARLVESDESITQIYLSAGFHSKSNFNREFNRITGTSPSEYRLRQAKAEVDK